MVVMLLILLFAVSDTFAYELRLQDGSTENEGRVEIRVDDVWGGICDTAWWTPESDAVCKKLGYGHGSSSTFLKAHFNKGAGPIFFYSVNCSSGVAFNDCEFVPISQRTCSQSREVGVRCSTGEENGDSDSNSTLAIVIIILLLVIVICVCVGCYIFIRKRRQASKGHTHVEMKSDEEEQQKQPINDAEKHQSEDTEIKEEY